MICHPSLDIIDLDNFFPKGWRSSRHGRFGTVVIDLGNQNLHFWAMWIHDQKKRFCPSYKKPGIFSCHVWWDLRDPKGNHQFVQPSPFFPHHRHYGNAKLSMADSGGNTAAERGRLSGGLGYEPYLWEYVMMFFRDILWTICKGYFLVYILPFLWDKCGSKSSN